MPVMNNVVFCYVKLQQPVTKYQSETEFEYVVDCIVSEKEAKAFKKKYKKQPPKEVPTEDFEKAFKIKPPYPDQEDQFIIKMKKPAQYRDRQTKEMRPIPDKAKPRVLVPNGEGKLDDITYEVLVANGSKGVVQYEENSNDFGTFARLKAIRVDELIPYSSGGADFSELGEVDELADSSGFEGASSNTDSGYEEDAARDADEDSEEDDMY